MTSSNPVPASSHPVNLDYDHLLQRMCQLAAEEVGMDPAVVKPDSDLVADLNFDSLEQVNYAMNIEEEFAVSIPDALAEAVKTPRQAADALMQALGQNATIPK